MEHLIRIDLAMNVVSRYSQSAQRQYYRTAAVKFQYSFATTSSENPFSVLSIPTDSKYETVKAAFIKAALRHHPDHSKAPESTGEFVRIRRAFEEITAVHQKRGNNVTSDINSNIPVWETEDEFNKWLKMAVGEYFALHVNRQTCDEIIHVYRTMSSGGLDKGGHWEMARQLTEREDAFRRTGGGSFRDKNGNKLSSDSTAPSTSNPLRRARKR